MGAYYNEIDRYAAQWLRNLIAAGHIAPGDVDERSITEVRPDDLRGYRQCHFFAGIGGWSYALRLAGWPDDRPVWTGSCPCQPFSVAGKRAGGASDRHLWPAWFDLIRECRPAIVLGEQVEGAIRHGWLDLVRVDLEDCGYAFGAAVLPAACVGAPHIRSRVWFVANSQCRSAERSGHDLAETSGKVEGREAERKWLRTDSRTSSQPCDVADADAPGRREQRLTQLLDAERPAQRDHTDGCSEAGNAWSDCDWLSCADGKARPVEPGTFPLAHGIPNKVGRLRAYGNAIVPQVAAVFVMATEGNDGPLEQHQGRRGPAV